MILNTTTLAHDVGQARCQQHGGMLPEPRSQQENDFLDELGTSMFTLGMQDTVSEDVWRWDTDRSEVIFQAWRPGQPGNGADALGVPEDCAVMGRDYSDVSGGPTWSWDDLPCDSDSYWDGKPKSLICQRKPGT